MAFSGKSYRALIAILATICTASLMCTGCSPSGAGAPGSTDGAGVVSRQPQPELSPAERKPSHAGETQPGQFQTMSGLGVNANVHSWNDGELKPAIDRIAELGDVTWRVIIDRADWESEMNPDPVEVIDAGHYAPIYEQGKMADLWDTVEYINSKPGQQVMLNVMGGVPAWMGETRIDEASEDQWVRMIASMVSYGRTVRGLDFTLLGPLNEIDWNGIEGPQVGPDQYVRLLRKLIIRLDSLGLTDIRLVGPDTASTAKAINDYLPVLVRDDLVMSRLAHFAIHSYDGDTAGTEAALVREGLDSGSVWVTEFSGPCPNCDVGSPNPTDWESAAANASYAIRFLLQGAAGVQHYDAWDGYYEHHESMGYWGLLAYDPDKGTYSPRKSYYVLRQLLKFVPRGSIRVAADSGLDSVPVVAFRDAPTGRWTIFGHNTTDAAVDVNLQVPDMQDTVQLETFATNAGKNMEQGSSVAGAQGSAKFTVPPGAVFTLTGSTLKGTSP